MIELSRVMAFQVSVNNMFWIGLELVLGYDPGVRVFAPQYLTRNGRVLGQLWYLPVSTTILIDLKLVT